MRQGGSRRPSLWRLLRRPASLAAALAAAALSAGCTVLSSETLEDLAARGEAPRGVHYCLPKQIIEFVLSADPKKAKFAFGKKELRSIRDKSHCFYLDYRPAPQYTDDISIEVSTSGYLKSVELVTKDESVEAIKYLAQAFVALEAADTTVVADEIAREWVDPTDADALARMEAKFSKALRQYAEAKRRANCAVADQADQPQDGLTIPNVAARTLCAEYERFATMARPLTVRFDRFAPGALSGAGDPRSFKAWVAEAKGGAGAPEADCRVGICYRVPEPWVLTVAIGETDVSRAGPRRRYGDGHVAHESVVRTIHLVSNRARLIEIDIRRAFLVEKTQKIAFDDNGLLDSIHIKKASELQALSHLPIDIIDAIADGLTLRIRVLDEQIGEANANKSLIEAQSALLKQKAALESYVLRTRGTSVGAATASRVPEFAPAAATTTTAATAPPIEREPPID